MSCWDSPSSLRVLFIRFIIVTLISFLSIDYQFDSLVLNDSIRISSWLFMLLESQSGFWVLSFGIRAWMAGFKSQFVSLLFLNIQIRSWTFLSLKSRYMPFFDLCLVFYLLFMEISFLSWKIRQISHLIIFQWVLTILLVDLVSRINFCCYCSSTRVAVHLGSSKFIFLLLWRKEVEEMLLLFLGSFNPSLPYPKCYGRKQKYLDLRDIRF